MSNFIKHISIDNFKSIRNCEISDCRRINLFIGRPNVGKSNILEALSLFSIHYLKENSFRKLSHLIRVENETELFYNGRADLDATVRTNEGECRLRYNPKEGLLATLNFFSDSCHFKIDSKLVVKGISNHPSFETAIKKYTYKQDVIYKKSHAKYLIPPLGYNLLSIIENYPELKREVIALFAEYRLQIAFDKSSQTIKVIKNDKDGIFLIPYNSIADTLKRIIFHKAAVASNDESVLLFEAPEAHSFPPCMIHLTQEMIHKSDNQYFVATHSPFILNDLLEKAQDELAVFMVYYEGRETKVRQLTQGELHDIFQDGVDLFTNSDSYV